MAKEYMENIFQSTHPVRGGTGLGCRPAKPFAISIHPPREGWDEFHDAEWVRFYISIHPPREGWDASRLSIRVRLCYFNPPTP